jgi:hypothetical protein
LILIAYRPLWFRRHAAAAVALILLVVHAKEPLLLAHPDKPQIESGFDLLYRLKFNDARGQFRIWQQTNPVDPLGYVATAASYLFEEFYGQHVLTSEYFLNNDRLLGGIQGKADEGRKLSFNTTNRKGRELALELLNRNPQDSEALFALTISAGMQADFAAILERRQLESLSLIKEAQNYAKRLLALQPDEADAWLSLGAANYILGSLPAYKRLFLWFERMHGNKDLGIEQLQKAAEKGHYLKPFAEIFLALAAMRENRIELARKCLNDLAAHFPENPLFHEELAHLGVH